MRKKLRIISLTMLVIAVVFIACALSAPNLGKVIYIGSIKIGAEQKRICYVIYVIAMAALFLASFFVKEKK